MILRELLLKLGLDVDTQSFAKGELLASSVKVALGTLASFAHRAGEAFKDAIEYGDKLDETAQATGVSTEALQQLAYAASFSGISMEELSGSLGKLSHTMAAAKEGSEEAQKAFSNIGGATKNGKLRDLEDVIESVADRFEKMPDGPKKVAEAMALFGRSGAHLIPFLNAGREGIAKLRQEADELGIVLDDKAIEASAQLSDSLDQLKATTLGLWRSAIAPLLPTLNDLIKKFIAWRRENAAVLKQTITRYIQTAIEAMKTFATILVGVYKGTMFLVDGLMQLWRALDGPWKYGVFAVLAFAFSPLLAIGAALAAVLLLIDDYRGYLAGEDSLIGRWKDALSDWMKPKGDDPWFLAAIKAFLRFVADAIKAVDEFGQKLQGATTRGEKAKVIGGAVMQAGKSTGGLIYDALPHPESAKSADARFDEARARGLGWFASAKYGLFGGDLPAAEVKPGETKGAGGSVSYSPQTQITINPPPNASVMDIGDEVERRMQSLNDRQWEEAGAALSSSP